MDLVDSLYRLAHRPPRGICRALTTTLASFRYSISDMIALSRV